MAGRKIKDAADARRCFSAAAASGLTPVEWARKRGIDGRSLNAWRMNLERRGAVLGQRREGLSKPKSGAIRLVELVAEPSASAVAVAPARYVVRTATSSSEKVASFGFTFVRPPVMSSGPRSWMIARGAAPHA